MLSAGKSAGRIRNDEVVGSIPTSSTNESIPLTFASTCSTSAGAACKTRDPSDIRPGAGDISLVALRGSRLYLAQRTWIVQLVPHNGNGGVCDGGLDTRELRDVLDRVMDKGIVVDPASRLEMIGDEPIDDGVRYIVGSVDTDF